MKDDPSQGFLQDILAHLERDDVRLIMADWLEEQGNLARAEFIRVQCELSRLVIPWTGCIALKNLNRVTYLHDQERKLLEANVLDWCRPLGLGTVLASAGEFEMGACFADGAEMKAAVEFRRGFVAHICLTCAAWLEHGPRAVREHPLERVELSDRKPYAGYPDADFDDSGEQRGFWWDRGWQFDDTAMQAVAADLLNINRYMLPPELFDLLPPGELDASDVHSTIEGRRHAYSSKERATAVLSTACLTWARQATPWPSPVTT